MKLKTLGGLGLDGAPLSRPKPLLLLAYLSLEGAKERRSLAELFYLGAAKPMASLRGALKQIRDEAAGAATVEGSKLVPGLTSDATKLLKASEQHDDEQTVALYSGAFLDGFHLKDVGIELEEWVYTTREYIAQQVRAAHLRLAQQNAAAGRFKKAAQHAENAYKLAGAAELEPEILAQLYDYLLAGENLLASAVKREAEGYRIALTGTTATLKADFLAEQPAATVPHNLPVAASSFVGRKAELKTLTDLLADPAKRVVTLQGLGGVGKTRLALEAARGQLGAGTFKDGVFIAFLDTATEASRALALVAQAAGLNLPPSEHSVARLSKALGHKKILLLLDNFEQLRAHAALLAELCAACPNLTLIVTSREQLGIEAEWLLPLRGLAAPELTEQRGAGAAPAPTHHDAVDLFAQRASRARLDFQLNDAALPGVVQLCALVDGSPLAIELAAALVKIMPVADIAAEVQQSLDVLASEQQTSTRHRSIRATFEASWERLSKSEQRCLRSLSVFRGGFSRAAAGEVAGATIPLLVSLVNKSVLRVDASGRYDRHPLLRRYSAEKLELYPEEKAHAEAQHALYFAAFARVNSTQEGEHTEKYARMARLSLEFENLSAANRYALAKRDIPLLAALFWPVRVFWFFKGDIATGTEQFEALMTLPEMRVAALPQLQLSWSAAAALLRGGRLEAASTLLHRCDTLCEQLGADDIHLMTHIQLGEIATLQCDYARADARYRAGHALALRVGDGSFALAFEKASAELAYLRGHYREAEPVLARGAALTKQHGSVWEQSYATQKLANCLRDAGNYSAAAELYGECIAVLKDLSEHAHLAGPLLQLGTLKLFAGELAEARGLLEQSHTLYSAQNAQREAAVCALHLADVALLEGNKQGAQTHLRDSLRTLETLGAKADLVHALGTCIHYLVQTQNARAALSLGAAARQLHSDLEVGQPVYRRELLNTQLENARAQLGGSANHPPDRLTVAAVEQTLTEALNYALVQTAVAAPVVGD